MSHTTWGSIAQTDPNRPFECQIVQPLDTTDFDYFGNSCAVSSLGDVMVSGAPFGDTDANLLNSVNNAGNVYVFRRNTTKWTQDAKLAAPQVNRLADARYGHSVDISSDGLTIAVAAHHESTEAFRSGAVYVYTYAAKTWSLQQRISAPIPGSGVRFGWHVELSSDGNTLLVTAPFVTSAFTEDGVGYVYTRTAGVWSLAATLKTAVPVAFDKLGYGLALSPDGSTVALGALISTQQGKVYIYKKGGAWANKTEDQILVASDGAAFDYFGAGPGNEPEIWAYTPVAFSKDGAVLVVGAYGWEGLSGASRGAVYVFRAAAGVWSETQIISGQSQAQDIHLFGGSVSLSGDGKRLAIGAQSDDAAAVDSGAFYIYEDRGGSFIETWRIKANSPSESSFSGFDIDLSSEGEFLASGASDYNGSGQDRGAVYMYHLFGEWVVQPA